MISSFYDKINHNYNICQDNIANNIDVNQKYDYVFNDNIVEIFDDKKLIIKAEYNIVGVYNLALSIWYWGWGIAFINKELIKVIKNIKKFKNVLEEDYRNFTLQESDEIYYFLSNNNFYIKMNNLNKLIKLVLYVTKGIWIIPIIYNYNNKHEYTADKIKYILITKIIKY